MKLTITALLAAIVVALAGPGIAFAQDAAAEAPAAETAAKTESAEPEADAEAGDAETADATQTDTSEVCTVRDVKGTVEWRPTKDDDWAPLSDGDTLPLGADIATGFRAGCTLVFADEAAVVALKPMTMVRIGEFERQGKKVRARLYQLQGRSESAVEKTRFESDFAIVTPDNTIAVRGTSGIQVAALTGFGSKVGLKTSGRLLVRSNRPEMKERTRDITPGKSTDSKMTMPIQQTVKKSMTPMHDTRGGMTKAEKDAVEKKTSTGGSFGTPNQTAPNGNNNSSGGNPRQKSYANWVNERRDSSGNRVIHEWEIP